MYGARHVHIPWSRGYKLSQNAIFNSLAFIRSSTLAFKFVLLATALIVCGMLGLGYWVSAQIEKDVVHHSATAIAYELRNSLEPMQDELDTQVPVSSATVARLDALLGNQTVGVGKGLVKIWSRQSVIIYSTKHEYHGKSYPSSKTITDAFGGELVAEFDDLDSDENIGERTLATHFLEIYVPVFSKQSGTVIAVAEMYRPANELAGDILEAKMHSAVVLALISAIMLLALYGIVGPASRTLDDQKRKLKRQVSELNGLLLKTQTLQNQIISANQSVVDGQERMLTRVSADIHDGPIQLISLALMNFPVAAGTAFASKDGTHQNQSASEYLKEALSELRLMASGLSLPELNNLTVAGVLENAARHHEKSTKTLVRRKFHGNLPRVSSAMTNCIYRFVQEGLMNSYRHAGAMGQELTTFIEDGVLQVVVSDNGPGFSPSVKVSDERLGLWGMRCRVISVGGDLKISSTVGAGTSLCASFRIPFAGDSNE
jgi:signal transduction histidine kinase